MSLCVLGSRVVFDYPRRTCNIHYVESSRSYIRVLFVTLLNMLFKRVHLSMMERVAKIMKDFHMRPVQRIEYSFDPYTNCRSIRYILIAFYHCHVFSWFGVYLSLSLNLSAGLGGSVGCAVRLETRRFNPSRGRHHSFVEIGHEIFSTVILSR